MTFRKIHLTPLLICLGFFIRTSAQLGIVNNTNPLQLAQYLAGSGVSVANATVNCSPTSIGTFYNGQTTNLGLDSGVVLSTGNISDIPNSSSYFASTDEGMPDDSDLDNLEGIAYGEFLAYDACSLQFDVTPAGDTLSFSYVFASEEYPDFVCSEFDDVFGFFISGPNPSGGNYSIQNIALIPGTNIPVSINTVNPGVSGIDGDGSCQSLSYSSDYIDNSNGNTIVYDGMTVVFTASIPVVPCQVYHLKLAIEDVGDGSYDSGVFIEANSLSSKSVNVIGAAAITGGTSTYRGCENGIFSFSIPQPTLTGTTIYFNITGTATNGIDYTTLPDSIVIPAGDSTASMILIPLPDGGGSASETVIVTILNSCNDSTPSSSFLTINEVPPAIATATPDTLCAGQSVQLQSNLGVAYVWSGPNLVSNNIWNPLANPGSNATYTVTVTDSSLCTATASVSVLVTSADSVQLHPVDASCGNNNGADTAMVTLGTGPFTYVWSNGGNSQIIGGLGAGTYSVTITGAGGCSATATSSVTSVSGLNLAGSSSSTSCGNNNGSAAINVTAGNGPYTYLWNDGLTTDSLSNLASGTYLVTVTGVGGCSATASVLVNSSSSNAVIITANKTQICASDSAQVCAPSGFLSYLWNTGETTMCIITSSTGAYYVTVTDTSGCLATSNQLTIWVYPQPPVSMSVNGDTLRAYNSSTYQWYFNGQPIPGDTMAMIIATQTGNYSVGITDSNGCGANSSNQYIKLATDINNMSHAQWIKVYPNPLITGSWQLEISSGWIGSWCEVFDASGKLVYRSQLENSKSEIELNVARGIYVMQIQSAQNTYVYKLIKL